MIVREVARSLKMSREKRAIHITGAPANSGSSTGWRAFARQI